MALYQLPPRFSSTWSNVKRARGCTRALDVRLAQTLRSSGADSALAHASVEVPGWLRHWESGVVGVLGKKKPVGQPLPQSVEALLSEHLLCQWYDDTDPEDGQVRRTGLIMHQLTEEWRSLGWSMTQISGLAQGVFRTRVRWIDGISSARRAMEQRPPARLVRHAELALRVAQLHAKA